MKGGCADQDVSLRIMHMFLIDQSLSRLHLLRTDSRRRKLLRIPDWVVASESAAYHVYVCMCIFTSPHVCIHILMQWPAVFQARGSQGKASPMQVTSNGRFAGAAWRACTRRLRSHTLEAPAQKDSWPRAGYLGIIIECRLFPLRRYCRFMYTTCMYACMRVCVNVM